MRAESFIASRLRFEGKLAVLAVAISFFVMIIAVAVSAGFRKGLRDGIAAIAGDVRLQSPGQSYTSDGGTPLNLGGSFEGIISDAPEVTEVNPVVYRAGIVRSGDNIHGVMFKGVPDGPDSLGISVPSRLADILSIAPGESLTAYFIGERVRVRRFTVRDVYTSILSGDENLVVFAGLADMQRLCGWSDSEVSAVELRLRDDADGPEVASRLAFRLLSAVPEDEDVPYVSSSREQFSAIYSWLDLIDFNVLVILLLMSVVAGFNMISGLLIMVFRNTSTIGTLKSLGMTDRAVSGVFLRAGSAVVLKGLLAGNALALLFCLVQGKWHPLKLNPENYFLSYVPVRVNILQVLAADVFAYLLILLLLLLVTLVIARIDPAKTLRAQ